MKYHTDLDGAFSGWVCSHEHGLLFDSDGNAFHKDEIRAIFFNRQLIDALTGSEANPKVVSLIQHLESKIKAVRAPRISVDWGDGYSQDMKHPLYG